VARALFPERTCKKSCLKHDAKIIPRLWGAYALEKIDQQKVLLAFAMKNKFIFCHVPKAAGTTMGRILKRNFGRAFYPYYGLYDHHMFTAYEVERILDLYPQYHCIASHMFSLRLPYDSANHKIHAFAFIRHPVDRVLSLYHYALKLCIDNPGSKHPGSLDEFYANILSDNQADGRFFDGQVRFLSGFGEESLQVEDLLGLAEKNGVLLAPTAAFDDACMLLEKRHPESFADASYPGRENIAPRNEEISEDLRSRILEVNEADAELFLRVGEIFSRRLNDELGRGLEEARADYKRRCASAGPDWLAEDETVALTKEERHLFEFLKKENNSLKEEVAFLRELPLGKASPIRGAHLAAIWRRLRLRSPE
jgi:hypothetical protein